MKLFHLLHNSTDEPAKKTVKEKKKKQQKKSKGKGNNGIPSTTVPPTPPSDSDGVAPIPPPVTEGEIKDELWWWPHLISGPTCYRQCLQNIDLSLLLFLVGVGGRLGGCYQYDMVLNVGQMFFL